MPLKKDPLLNALSDVRDDLKLRFKTATGRTPTVCTDETLREIAQRKPLKKSDFLAIQGVGETFVTYYAEDFLRVIYNYKNASIEQVNVSKQSKRILNDYKDRLTNISRRNRNLYTNKLAQKHAVDLYQYTLIEKLESLFNNKRVNKINLTDKRHDTTKEGEQFYRHLTMLYREINRETKETGSYNLHIAYPFIQGKLLGEGFEVKAPLLFFPVTLERSGYDFTLKIDNDKDVIINRDLFLANNKFNHFDHIKDHPEFNDTNLKNLEAIITPLLENNNIETKNTYQAKQAFSPFENTLKEDFKKVRKGHLEVKNYIVLGKYRIFSSKLQEDITTIINNKTYNALLKHLLDTPLKPYDYSLDNPFISASSDPIKEKNLTYINDLNYAQENVINQLNTNEKLVIWGPPGTGKSQTITSLIAKQVEQGDNVLVVSEKKVALDVIKSRLGYASKFAFFIDDAQDKTAFYTQIKSIIDPTPPVRNHNNDKPALDARIEKIIMKLRKLHHAFYFPNEGTLPLYKIYPRYIKTSKIDDELFPETVYKAFKAEFKTLNETMLDTIEHAFSNTQKLKNLLIYINHINTYPIIKRMNYKLTRSEKIKRTKFYQAYEKFIEDYDKAFFFNKRSKRNLFIKEHASQLTYLFSKQRIRKKFIKMLIKDQTFYQTIKKDFHRYERADFQYSKLNENAKTYLNMLLYSAPFNSIESIHTKHTTIFDAFYTGYIEKFEALNQDNVYDLNHYHDLMSKLDEAFSEKQSINQENFSMALYQDALNFSNSKRIMDIKRRIEQERKMSVSKFIDTYQLELFSNIKVWMMTPEVISEIIPLNFAMYDLVIFDEASQMFVEKAIPTIYRAKKVVIAGDTKQLRPSSLGQGRLIQDVDELDETETPITLDAQSLLDLSRYKYKEIILNYHYRSVYEELISFSNYAFYDGKLIVSPNKVQPTKPPIEYIICEDGIWDNRQNLAEAKKVVELIKKVIRLKHKDETIGIITFNTSQRNLIEDLLDETLFSTSRYAKKIEHELNRFEDGEDKSLFIKNIENVQGDERDIIIFSTAYAKNKDGRFLRQFGWLNNEGGQNRLNVAISRAKKKIYIVTSFHPQSLHVEDLKSVGPKRLKQYLQYCYHISNKETRLAQGVLETLSETTLSLSNTELTTLQKDVLARLEKEDQIIATNIGIGKYKIDFGIKDNKNNFDLGIICDINPTNTNDVRDLFYHQEKYLRARGWRIYRIFSGNWYTDPNKEMRQIRKLLREIQN